MLQVDYLVVADAVAAVEGKHYIQGGGWDNLFAAHFPATHPALGIAVRLRVPWNDTNRPYQVQLDIIDDDTQASILSSPPGPPSGVINLGRPPLLSPGADQVVCLAFNLYGLQFRQPGSYLAVVRIEGAEAGRSPFSVVALPPRPGAGS